METEERTEPADAEAQLERVRAELRAMQQRFRSIIEKTADGIVVVGAEDGVIRFANRAAGELFDRPPESLEGSEFGHPVVADETTEIDIFRRGEPAVAELRVMETEWEGGPAKIVSLRDITDRKKAEERERTLLREQVARSEAEEAARRAEMLSEASRRLSSSIALDETLQTIADFVVERVADYCVIDLADTGEVRRYTAARDEALSDLLERARAYPLDLDSDTPQARVYRDREPLLVRKVDDAWLDSATPDPGHTELARKLGPSSVVMVPLFAGRECHGVLTAASVRPETRLREHEKHLVDELARRAALALENARLYRDAQAANQAKANFLSVMSHELRTPLSAIIGYTDLMHRGVVGEVTDEQGEYLDRIRASSNHLLQIIEEILAFAGTEAGEESARPERSTVQKVVESVRAVAEPLAADGDAEFRIEVDAGDSELNTDVRKLRQILLNLLSNAFKFTDEGYVELRARVDGDDVVFEVEDTGIGIPEQRMESIFERFWQVEEALTRKAGGTGLGLTVARSFAELLEGSLSVDSEQGRGSTFTLRVLRDLESSLS